MTSRYPLVLISGALSELPTGDSVLGASITLVSEPSGLYLDGTNLGIDGSAIASGNAALELAELNEVLATNALASGNAALVDLTGKVAKTGDIVSGTLVVDSQSYGVVSSTISSGVILLDFSENNNFDVTLEGNSTLAPSASPSGGQSGAVYIRQDGTGSRTLSYSGGFSFSNGSAPTLTTTASGVDLLAYYSPESSTIVATLIAAVSGV